MSSSIPAVASDTEAERREIKLIWDAAIEEYRVASGDSGARPLNHATVDSLQSLQAHITKQNVDFKNFRERREKLLGAMKYALEPVRVMGNIVAGGVATIFAPTTQIFAAVTFLIQAAENVSKKYDTIITVFEEIRSFTEQLEILVQGLVAQGTEARPLRTSLVRTMVAVLKFIGSVEKAIKDGRLITFGKRALRSTDPVQDCKDELARNSQEVQRVVSSLTWTGQSRHNKDESMARDERERTAKLDALEKHLEVHDKMSDLFGRFRRKRLPDTCRWIQDDFERWRQSTIPLLWISGGRGTGKTHIAASLVESLSSQVRGDLSSPEYDESYAQPGFYFCRRESNALRDSSRRILDTLMWQFIKTCNTFFEHAARIYRKQTSLATSDDLIVEIFKSCIEDKNHRHAHVLVIDGLDELEEAEREEILSRLRNLCDLSQMQVETSGSVTLPIQIVLLGRHTLDDRISEEFLHEMIEVTPRRSEDDLDAYIEHSIANSRQLHSNDFSEDLREDVLDSLRTGADGSFLWVNLKVRELENQRQVSKVKKILDQPPVELGEELLGTLHSISEQERNPEILNTILAFTIWFGRPMYLSELSIIPRLESQSNEDDGFYGLEDLLLERCSPLFRLHRDDGYSPEALRRILPRQDVSWIDEPEPNLHGHRSRNSLSVAPQVPRRRSPSSPRRITYKPQSTTVSFDHASFHEIFFSIDKIEKGSVVLDKNFAYFRIARLCLVLLTDDDLWEELGEQPLKVHAALYFSEYLEEVDKSLLPEHHRTELASLLSRLFMERHVTRRWICALAIWSKQTHPYELLSHPRQLSEDIITLCLSWMEDGEKETHAAVDCPEKTADQVEDRRMVYSSWLQGFLSKLRIVATRERDVVRENMNATHQSRVREELACAVADEWLSSHGWVDETASPTDLHALFLCTFIAQTQDPALKEGDFLENALPLTPRSIRDAASWYLWSHYEGTAIWHTCLALTYYGLNYRRSAIKECERAIALDGTSWHAFYVLSLCHLNLNHAKIAMDSAQDALGLLPDALRWSKLHFRLLLHAARSKVVANSTDEAHRLMLEMLDQRENDTEALKTYLEFVDDAAHLHVDYKRVGIYLCNLYTASRSQLSELLLADDRVYDGDVHETILQALRACNQIRTAVEIYTSAIKTTESKDQAHHVPALEVELAGALFESRQSLEHPIRCLEQALDLEYLAHSGVDMDLSPKQQQVRYRGIALLARYRSAKLIRAKEQGDLETQKLCYEELSRLWEIGKTVNQYIPIWLWYQRHCWYHAGLANALMENTKEVLDFRSSSLRTVFRMMRGRGVSPKGLPFRRLAYIFQIAQDADAVYAALAQRVLIESSLAQSKEVGELGGFYDWHCDGPCTDKSKPWTTQQGVKHCMLCLDTDWCLECLPLLEQDQIAYTLCSANHPFVYLKPFEKPGEGMIMVGDRMIKLDEWLLTFKVECGLQAASLSQDAQAEAGAERSDSDWSESD